MAMSVNAIAYGAVGVVAVVLFAIGTPAQRAQGFALAIPHAAAAQQPAAAPTPQASIPAPPAPTASAAGITLRSLNVELPSSDRMFPGDAAADPLNANCLACHSAGMVLNQPALSRAEWEGEVNKMRNIYKAPVAAEDVPAIVAYLAALKPGG